MGDPPWQLGRLKGGKRDRVAAKRDTIHTHFSTSHLDLRRTLFKLLFLCSETLMSTSPRSI